MEYGGFEGIIPAGQYGGGTVMLWDQGTWEPQPGHTDVDAGLREGSLKFTLSGTKMHGNWTLVRMGGKAAKESKPNWLLIKEHDSYERNEGDRAITEEEPDSVVTQRSLEQIATSEDHVWNSKETAKGNAWKRRDKTVSKDHSATPLQRSSQRPTAKRVPHSPQLLDLADAPRESLPAFITPQLATLAVRPPTGEGWLNELKLDGYRLQCRLENGKVQLLTRNGLDWTDRMRSLAAELANLPAKSALLDGEVVVLNKDGNSNFAALQAAFQEEVESPLTYFSFDLLHLDGHAVRSLPLIRRKNILATLLEGASDTIRLSEHMDLDAGLMFRKACDLHAEGIICKRADAAYSQGRSSAWLKLKCIHEQEFVVAGFTLPAKGHKNLHGIGSLLLGYYRDERKLVYAGRTGTGFTGKMHSEIRTRLEALRQADNPFSAMPSEARRGAIWVQPTLVAQVRFATWTADGMLRQASFQGLRDDKPASDVGKEEPTMKPRPARKSISYTDPPPQASKAASGLEHATVHLTHPDKIVDPESQLTKQQLADYYWAIAAHMLPHIEGTPLSLVRCPEGSGKPCFFQKHTTAMLPSGIQSIDVPDKKTGKLEPYITLSTREALASLAQMGVLEIHPWGSRNSDLEHADRIIIDLDPDTSVPWSTLAAAASEVRKRFKQIGLETFLKSTGGKGLHIVAPMIPEHDWGVVKQFAHGFVLALERAQPGLYLTKMTKSARVGKIYLDYLRNERGATAVAPFSPRARAGAPVSRPLPWSALKLKERPLFYVSNYETWQTPLSRDPWRALTQIQQSLSADALQLFGVRA